MILRGVFDPYQPTFRDRERAAILDLVSKNALHAEDVREMSPPGPFSINNWPKRTQSLIRTLSVWGAPLPTLIHLVWPSLMPTTQQKGVVFKVIPPLTSLWSCRGRAVPPSCPTHTREPMPAGPLPARLCHQPLLVSTPDHTVRCWAPLVSSPPEEGSRTRLRSSQLSPDVFSGQNVLQQHLPVGLSLFTPK